MKMYLFVLFAATALVLSVPASIQAQPAGCCETGGNCTRVDTEDECKTEANGARYYFAETGFCANGTCQASIETPDEVQPWEQPEQPVQPTTFGTATPVGDPEEDPSAAGCCQTSESTCVQTDDIERCGVDNWMQLATCDEQGVCQGTAANPPIRVTALTAGFLQTETCASIF